MNTNDVTKLSLRRAPGSPVLSVGHRGARGHAPENTLASFNLAVEMGVQAVETDVHFTADGEIPFPQVILHAPGRVLLLKGEAIRSSRTAAGNWHYVTRVPAGKLTGGGVAIQIEGCRQADIGLAGGDDWIKAFRDLRLIRPSRPAAIRAQVSRSPTARLKTGWPGVESGSAQK